MKIFATTALLAAALSASAAFGQSPGDAITWRSNHADGNWIAHQTPGRCNLNFGSQPTSRDDLGISIFTDKGDKVFYYIAFLTPRDVFPAEAMSSPQTLNNFPVQIAITMKDGEKIFGAVQASKHPPKPKEKFSYSISLNKGALNMLANASSIELLTKDRGPKAKVNFGASALAAAMAKINACAKAL
ncbi:hypothetical protein [Pontixanthobacter aquaemixtae]|uniref:Uncharacterized protein n=1 Tax=Pontixanthobacter aquaemixtae TaxID=1958940 RepID=A0A844ZUK3_9SPHN|nr:hypothetical protein [Pontixanthobacter aquaemixtae]MXO91663.1 hypothetical protein [Pontixanthobacter aquaemixtae]